MKCGTVHAEGSILLYRIPVLGKRHGALQNDWLREVLVALILPIIQRRAELAGGGGERLPQLPSAAQRTLAWLVSSEAEGRVGWRWEAGGDGVGWIPLTPQGTASEAWSGIWPSHLVNLSRARQSHIWLSSG